MPSTLKMLRTTEVMSKLERGRTKIWNEVNQGTLPKPIIAGKNAAWVEAELDQVLIFRLAGKSDSEVQRLVNHLHEQRVEAAKYISL